MNRKYPLPKLECMDIEGYDLYKCPMVIDFKKIKHSIWNKWIGKNDITYNDSICYYWTLLWCTEI